MTLLNYNILCKDVQTPTGGGSSNESQILEVVDADGCHLEKGDIILVKNGRARYVWIPYPNMDGQWRWFWIVQYGNVLAKL